MCAWLGISVCQEVREQRLAAETDFDLKKSGDGRVPRSSTENRTLQKFVFRFSRTSYVHLAGRDTLTLSEKKVATATSNTEDMKSTSFSTKHHHSSSETKYNCVAFSSLLSFAADPVYVVESLEADSGCDIFVIAALRRDDKVEDFAEPSLLPEVRSPASATGAGASRQSKPRLQQHYRAWTIPELDAFLSDFQDRLLLVGLQTGIYPDGQLAVLVRKHLFTEGNGKATPSASERPALGNGKVSPLVSERPALQPASSPFSPWLLPIPKLLEKLPSTLTLYEYDMSIGRVSGSPLFSADNLTTIDADRLWPSTAQLVAFGHRSRPRGPHPSAAEQLKLFSHRHQDQAMNLDLQTIAIPQHGYYTITTTKPIPLVHPLLRPGWLSRRPFDRFFLHEDAQLQPASRLKRFFNDRNSTDEHQKEVYAFAALLVEKLGLKEVFDVGCGSGWKLVHMLTKEWFATGTRTANRLDATSTSTLRRVSSTEEQDEAETSSTSSTGSTHSCTSTSTSCSPGPATTSTTSSTTHDTSRDTSHNTSHDTSSSIWKELRKTGFDVFPTLAFLRQSYKMKNLRWLTGSEDYIFANATSNSSPCLVLASDVIEHVEDPGSFLDFLTGEKFEVCNYLLLSTPRREWASPVIPKNAHHIREWDSVEFPTWLAVFLSRKGWAVVDSFVGLQRAATQVVFLERRQRHLPATSIG
ncbi:unnamed protein product [Amoebophrya sp. A25]|nr:unnamed protein product [Amoebophrya sp. A25]|eukprot:GSA25T00010843001.1